MQVVLKGKQIENFHHDHFVEDQVRAFLDLQKPIGKDDGVIADIGGGCGYFAKTIRARIGAKVRVLDTDPKSVRICQDFGIDAELSDALNPQVHGDETVICFNLILHHLVGKTEASTLDLQSKALKIWKSSLRQIFVHEYIYESYISEKISGFLIWKITSNKILSKLCMSVSKIVPSLRANTFGVGVRFRAKREWVDIFESIGFKIVGYEKGKDEGVSIARRMLLIKNCRRDSFVLESKKGG